MTGRSVSWKKEYINDIIVNRIKNSSEKKPKLANTVSVKNSAELSEKKVRKQLEKNQTEDTIMYKNLSTIINKFPSKCLKEDEIKIDILRGERCFPRTEVLGKKSKKIFSSTTYHHIIPFSATKNLINYLAKTRSEVAEETVMAYLNWIGIEDINIRKQLIYLIKMRMPLDDQNFGSRELENAVNCIYWIPWNTVVGPHNSVRLDDMA